MSIRVPIVRSPVQSVVHSPALGPLTGRGGGGLSLLDQMNQYAAEGLFVSWLHLGDTTALFDDDTGGDNLAHNDTLGLALGREDMADFATASAFIADQSELITNGGFGADSDWTKGAGWTISAGTANASSSSAALEQAGVTSAGTTVWIEYTISGYSAGNVTPFAGTTNGSAASANGTLVQVLEAATDGDVGFTGSSLTASIDDVSVKAVPGNHWKQATAANRPLYYSSSNVTYLTYDGTNDDLQSVPHTGEHSYFICIDTEDTRGILFHDIATNPLFFGVVWENGNPYQSHGHVSNAGPNASVWVYDPGTETWDEAETRDDLHDLIVGLGPKVIELRQFSPTGYNLIHTNGYTAYEWAGDHSDIVVVAEADRTDDMAVNIAKYTLEQMGAS